MTEEGIPECSPSHTADINIADCLLCLQKLRCPKSLPCLHSFCEECLKKSILSQRQDTAEQLSFFCPACGDTHLPVDQEKDSAEWAMMFEADKLTKELTSEGPNGENLFKCNPCSRKGKSGVMASVWWKEANRYLCESCKKNDLITEDDNLLSIEGGCLPTPSYCLRHAADLDMICDDHHNICCPKCIAIDHRRCETVHNYADFVSSLRTGSQREDLKQKLTDAVNALSMIVTDVKEHKKTLRRDKDGFVADVKELRVKIEKQIEQLQDALCKEVCRSVDDKEEELDALISKCELMKRCISATTCLLETDDIQRNDVHMVHTYQRGEMEIEAGRRLVQEIAEPYLTWRFTHKIDKQVDTNEEENESDNEAEVESGETAKNLLSFLSLGSLRTTSHDREFPVDSSVLLPMSLSSAREVNAIQVRTSSDVNDCHITGLVYLEDGRCLVSDCGNEKLKMFSADGGLLDEVELSLCRDICMKDSDTVVVTRHSEGVISFVKIDSAKKLKFDSESNIRVGKKCDALTFDKVNLVFATSYDSMSYDVCKVPVAPDGYRTDITWTQSYVTGVTYDTSADAIFLTTAVDGENSVYRIVNGDLHEVTCADRLSSPSGLDSDRDGNLYVCCAEEIIQISKQGKIRSLVDVSDPFRISVCGNKFAVSMKTQDTIKFFEI
ncbi:uncharacterized protein [Argopecten irradians]